MIYISLLLLLRRTAVIFYRRRRWVSLIAHKSFLVVSRISLRNKFWSEQLVVALEFTITCLVIFHDSDQLILHEMDLWSLGYLSSFTTAFVSHIEVHHGISGPLGPHPTNEWKKWPTSQILSNVVRRTNLLKQSSYFGAGTGRKETLFLQTSILSLSKQLDMWVLYIYIYWQQVLSTT